MSCGQLNYFYNRLGDSIYEIRDYYHDLCCPVCGTKPDNEKWLLICNFINKLNLLKEAMHDIEWVISGDKSDGDELAAIKLFLEADKN